MNEEFPAKAYRDNVLDDCFSDAKRYFLPHYLDVDRAHAIMLGEQGIISAAERRAILDAIESLDLDGIRRTDYDGSVEDLFFYLQREIAAACRDGDTAGRLHTARSRNDIDVTIYRMELRRRTLGLIAAAQALNQAFLDLAAAHLTSLMPAYTHTQPAQPTTVGHFLLAMAENTNRDIGRLTGAFANMNRCPLGACAITTTGFPIDRHRVAELLGFDAPTRNAYASIASVDYFTELLGAIATTLINVGRFAQEFLLMTMTEFDVLRLPDGYVQSSSIMPQKRNPVAIEHVRALASKALGQGLGVLTAVHNTPFGDINDVEDDLQPLVFNTVRDATRSVSLLGEALAAAEFNLEALNKRAGSNFITVTELADTIVRREGLPFSKAHAIVASCVARALRENGRITHGMLQKAALEHAGTELGLDESALQKALSAGNFVDVRSVYGGPAAGEAGRALDELRAQAAENGRWLEAADQRLQAARNALHALSRSIAGRA